MLHVKQIYKVFRIHWVEPISNSWTIEMFLAFSRPDLFSILANILTASKPISTNYQLEQTRLIESIQCVKSFHIRSYSGPHFSRIFSHFHRIRSIRNLCIQSKFGKNVWWIVLVVWLTDERRLALFTAGTTVTNPHHGKYPRHHEQDLNLHRTWVKAQLNEVVH